MRKDKKYIFDLRKTGKTYTEISILTGVSKATLSVWFKNNSWAKEVLNQHLSQEAILHRVTLMNLARSKKMVDHYAQIRKKASEKFSKYKNDPIFVAGLMLYLGEGDKNLKLNPVRISNVDFNVLKIFISFSKLYLDIPIERIKCWLLLYPDLDKSTCEEKWQKELGLTPNNFYKSQIIQGRHKTKRLIYGVGNIIIGSKYLKVEVIELIRLLSEYLLQADMV